MKFSQKGCVGWLGAAAALTLFLAMGLSHHTGGVAFAQEVLTNENVIAMVRAGLPEAVIVAKIQSTPTKFDLTTNGLIALKQAGVPDNILVTMVSGGGTGAAGAPAAGAPGVPAPADPALAAPPPAATVPGTPTPTAVSGFAPVGAPQPFVPPGGNLTPGASGCPQLTQPDPYGDFRNSLGQLRAQAAQPGAQPLGQSEPLMNQIQAALDARDAALRQGACDTTAYDQQISSLAANLQTAMASPPQPGGATPFPQQAGVPGGAPGAPSSPGPEGQSQPGVGGDMFSKLFESLQGLAGKSRGGSDSESGAIMTAPPAGAYTPGPASPSDPGTSPGSPPGPSPGPTGDTGPGGTPSPSTPTGPVATVRGTVRNESGVALASATVTAVEWNKSTTTAPDGTYYLQGPGGQQVTVQAAASGYQKKSNVTSVPPGAMTWQNFALKKATSPMPTKLLVPPAVRQPIPQIPRPLLPRP